MTDTEELPKPDDRYVITEEMKARKAEEERKAAERKAEQEARDLEARLNCGPRKGPSPKPEAKTPWPQQNIPIKDIKVGERLRPLNEEEVEKKMASITEVGLLNAITVCRTNRTKGNPPRPVYGLRAGLHRLEACKRLKWIEIPAVITTLVGPRADLIEVDEDLMQTTLSPTQRATFTKRRKALYEALYPDTAKGNAQAKGMRRAAAAKAAAGPDGKVCREVSNGEAQAIDPVISPELAAFFDKYNEKSKSQPQSHHAPWSTKGIAASTHEQRLEFLRKAAPDLDKRVWQAKDMTLEEAEAEFQERMASVKKSLGHKLTKEDEEALARSQARVTAKPKSFVEDTAEKTGRSERTVRLEGERGEKVADARSFSASSTWPLSSGVPVIASFTSAARCAQDGVHFIMPNAVGVEPGQVAFS